MCGYDWLLAAIYGYSWLKWYAKSTQKYFSYPKVMIKILTFLRFFIMKYSVYVDNTRKNKKGLYQVYVLFKDNGKAFRVGTGIYSSVKFVGREFPKQEGNAKAKTNALNRILLAVEDYLLAHRKELFAIKKDALKAIVSGKEKVSFDKHFADYVDDFCKTKTNAGTRTTRSSQPCKTKSATTKTSTT